MRLVTYLADGAWRGGVVHGDAVVDLGAALGEAGPVSVRSALERGLDGLAADRTGSGRPLDQVRLGPPVPDPDKILCIGLNYHDHAAESGQAPPPAPVVFAKFRNSLAGPADDVPVPAACTSVDYEGELAVVIGARARDVPVERALDHVAGAMVLNDVTDRALQMGVSQWTVGKAIDAFAPCGPALVTLDECGPLDALRITTVVNGQTYQDGSTAALIFDVPYLVSYLSRTMTLEPGDIISTGTPAGVGFGVRPARYLAPGDVVEITIEGLGTIHNTIVAEAGVA